MRKPIYAFLLAVIFAVGALSCGDVEKTLLVGGTEVPYDKLSINMFPRNRSLGSLTSQMADVKKLGFKAVRVTFWFDAQFMPSADSARDYTKFDEVVDAAEENGLEIIAILAYVPDWLEGDTNWKTTFVNDYVSPVVSRYSGRIKYYEVWNEPDEMTHNVLDGSASDYFDLLKKVSSAIRSKDSSATIVSAATASIVTDGVAKWNWTQELLDSGLSKYADVLNIHYYSELDIELSSFGGNMAKNTDMRIWVTETGKGVQSKQKSYFEEVVPYIEKSLAPERIFWYCYVEGEGEDEAIASESTYGLVTNYNGERTESPLYTHLKSRG